MEFNISVKEPIITDFLVESIDSHIDKEIDKYYAEFITINNREFKVSSYRMVILIRMLAKHIHYCCKNNIYGCDRSLKYTMQILINLNIKHHNEDENKTASNN